MAQDRPRDAAVFELGNADLTREGAVGLVVDVLGRDFDIGAAVFADEEEVDRWWGDHHLWGREDSDQPEFCRGNAAGERVSTHRHWDPG